MDHVMDLPYIARKTGAMVIGTESTCNVGRAYGIGREKLIEVKAERSFSLGRFRSVIPSLHGVLRRAPNSRIHPNEPLSTGVPANAKTPLRLQDFHEGGTLAYLIRIGGRQILVFGSMSPIEREGEDCVGTSRCRNGARFTSTHRIARSGESATGAADALGPDECDIRLSQEPAIHRLPSFLDEVKEASPETTVRIPKYFEPITIPC
jgi:hypothetical protein